MNTPFVAIPVRSFTDAKRRLSPELDARSRERLARALATHTAVAITESGARPTIVSSDADVASWAADNGFDLLSEPESGGLDGAAAAAVESAGERCWLVVHSDLPLVTQHELRRTYDVIAEGSTLLAPSYDGGTTAVGGSGTFRFSYGRSSFHRHLQSAPTSRIITSLGFLLDIDSPDDLAAARAHPRGAWLAEFTSDVVI